MPEHAIRARQHLAEAVGRRMYERDHISHALGITLEAIRPGYARLTMRVRQDMLNSHQLLHGGMTFTLADTAFAYACNSHDRTAVATGCNIVFPATGHEGDQLTAEAVECHLSGRSGVCDVTVTNQKGEVIALFRGQSRQMQGTVLAGEDD